MVVRDEREEICEGRAREEREGGVGRRGERKREGGGLSDVTSKLTEVFAGRQGDNNT